MIVFLVGAGATLAEALPGHPTQADTPPLDATFFHLCSKAAYDGKSQLRRYLKSQYGIDPLDGGFGMEEVFNIVYADARSGTPSPGCIDAYWALLGMYRDTIAHTTNRLTGTSRAGIGFLLRFFARKGERDFTFVTFNQDLVIEKAIDAAKKTQRYGSLPWDINNAYEIRFSGVHTVSRQSRLPFHSEGSPLPKPIHVLKLHGSLNWVYRVRSAADAKNSLRSARGDLKLLNEQTILSRVYDGTGNRRTPLLPFIVPPVYEKSAHIRDVVQPAWDSARQALRTADELVIFGYSCPAADQAARNMIKNAFHHNSSVNHVHIIDPSPSTSARIGELLGAPVVSRYCTVADFVTHYRSA